MTEFYLATKAWQFVQCHRLADRANYTVVGRLSYPTIIGVRDEKVVGFISTAEPGTYEMVTIGNMLIDPDIKNPGHLIFRMFDTYHAFMHRINIISYYSFVSKKNPVWIETIKKLGIPVYYEDNDYVWFNHRTKQKGAA
jgi:hypothetical protein